MKRVFFNNCRKRDHASLYGEQAFYDLYRAGRQASMAADLRRGDQCIVATPTIRDRIEFQWFSYGREVNTREPDGKHLDVQVLYGEWFRSETLPKTVATTTEPYSVLFDVNGHFKRPSVIESKIRRSAPPIAGARRQRKRQ